MNRLFNRSLVSLAFIAATFQCSAIFAAVTEEQLGRILLRGRFESVTQKFQPGRHAGIDFRAQKPIPFFSPVAGKVNVKDATNGFLAIVGEDGNTYIFLHLSQIRVSKGDSVSPGAELGMTGATLYKNVKISGPHLHFEVRKGTRTSPADEADKQTVLDPTKAVNLEVIVARVLGPIDVTSGKTANYRLHLDLNDGSVRDLTGSATWTETGSSTTIGHGGVLSSKRTRKDEYVYVGSVFSWNGKKRFAELKVRIRAS